MSNGFVPSRKVMGCILFATSVLCRNLARANRGYRRERDGRLAILPPRVAATHDSVWVQKSPSKEISGSPEHVAAERAAPKDWVHDDGKHSVRGGYGHQYSIGRGFGVVERGL